MTDFEQLRVDFEVAERAALERVLGGRMTQTNRVLALLYRRGQIGVTPMDFMPPTCDGGPSIMRLAPRILELRNQGFVITTDKTGGYATYRLRPGVLSAEDAAQSAGDAT